MRYKKIILGVIISAFFLGLVTSCGSYSCDFNSGEEAQEYVLAKLEDKYDEEFTITDVKKYKEEKIGLNWIAVNIASKKNPSRTATVYARNTGYFKDDYHIYYYIDEIKKLVEPLCNNKSYIQKYDVKIEGHMTTTEWTGKETFEEYLKKAEYTAVLTIYLQEGKTDEQYAEEISDWLNTLGETDYRIRAVVRTVETETMIFDEELGTKNKDMSMYSLEWLQKEIPHTRSLSNTIKEYKEWKKANAER